MIYKFNWRLVGMLTTNVFKNKNCQINVKNFVDLISAFLATKIFVNFKFHEWIYLIN